MATIHQDWTYRIPSSLWAYHTNWHNTTRFLPYQRVYSRSPIFPIKFQIKTLQTTRKFILDLLEAQK